MNRSASRASQALKRLNINSNAIPKRSYPFLQSNVLAAVKSGQKSQTVTIGLHNVLRQSKQWYTTTATTTSTSPSEESKVASEEDALGDCPGCGAPFQKSNPSLPGYLAERKSNAISKKKQQNKSLSAEDYQAALDKLDPETRALLEGEPNENTLEQPLHNTAQHTERNVCQRCYALQHHNASTTSSTPDFLRSSQQFGSLNFLKTKRNPLLVAVFDVTDLPASMGHLPKLIQQNPGARILLAANKMDLLPASARRHEQRIRDWILQHMKSIGVPTQQIVSVTLISAKKGWGIPSLMRKMDHERLPTDDIYLVGSTNVGKSALVNQFMSQIRGTLDAEGRQWKSQLRAQYKITSSAVPGTTMGTIKVPLYALGMSSNDEKEHGRLVTRDRFLIDTPGIINDQQLIHQLDYSQQKKLVNQKEMNPITFKLEPGKSLLLKPLVRIDLLESDSPVLFTMFSPLAPHLTKTDKLPAAHALQDRDTRLRPIKDQSILQMNSLEPMDETVRVKGLHRSHATVDFSFAGVGWVSLIGEFDRATFRIWLPKNVDPHQVFKMRDPPFLPYEYKGSIRKFFGSGERTRK